MKTYCSIFLIFISTYASLAAEKLNLKVNAQAALLVNVNTGAVLYEKEAHTLFYPASITKVATAAYALKMAGDKLDTVIAAEQDAIGTITDEKLIKSNYTLPSYWLVPGSSHIGIKRDEELTLKDLLYGMMLASGDDASNVIAQFVGGTIPNFMTSLNGYLKEIGCKNTTFYNPHGLFHPKHQTTAWDIMVMMREAIKNPVFCEIIGTARYTRPKTNKQKSTVLVQTNRLIRKGKHHYAKAIGGKTGYLSKAGNTLVVAAKQDNRLLIAVLLKSSDRTQMFEDAIKMFETAFNQPKVQQTLLKAGKQKWALELPRASKPITTYLPEDVVFEYYPAEEPKLKCLLYWTAKTLPVVKDQQVGELHIQTTEGQLVRKVALLAQEEVSTSWYRSLF